MRIVAAALFALAAVLVGFAHRPLVSAAIDSAVPFDLAVRMLPDGTVPDLCHVDADDPVERHPGLAAICDACLLTGSPGLDGAAAAAMPVLVGRMPAPEIARAQVAAGEPTRSPTSRGPPATA